MDLILFDKGLEMSGLKKKEGMEAGTNVGKVVWFLISISAFGIALYHSYNANKCEKNTAKLVMAVVLALLFPKISAIYYLFKYGLPKFDEKGMAELSKAYRTKASSWDDVKCKLPEPKSTPSLEAVEKEKGILEGGYDLDTMYGGW
jgi:hypothetical protein